MGNLPITKPELRALYEAAGHEAGLETILKDFYRRMSKDTMIGFFFEGRDTDAIAVKQKEFMMKAIGVAPSYEGKPPAKAHAALPPILHGHFHRRLQILGDVLRDHGLSDEKVKIWIQFEKAFESVIVKK